MRRLFLVTLGIVVGVVAPAHASGPPNAPRAFSADMAPRPVSGSAAGTCELFADDDQSQWHVICHLEGEQAIEVVELRGDEAAFVLQSDVTARGAGIYEASFRYPTAAHGVLLVREALAITLGAFDGSVEAEGVFRLGEQTWTHYALAQVYGDASTPPLVGACALVTTVMHLGFACTSTFPALDFADLREGTSVDNVNENEVLLDLADFLPFGAGSTFSGFLQVAPDLIQLVRAGQVFVSLGIGVPEPFQVVGGAASPCHATLNAPCLDGYRIAVTVDEDSVPDETVSLRTWLSGTEVLFLVQRPPETDATATEVDVFVEVQCDAGQFVAAAISQGFPPENRYSLTVTLADRMTGVSGQMSGITEVSRDGILRFGTCSDE